MRSKLRPKNVRDPTRASLAVGEIELMRHPVVLLDVRVFARRDDSAREPSKPGGKANARELTADS